MHFKQYAETHTNRKLVKLHVHETHGSNSEMMKLNVLRTDNSGEYLSNKLKHYLGENGISHELMVAYTPQQSGVAERMNRTILDLVRSILHHEGIDERLRAQALAIPVYDRYRVTSRFSCLARQNHSISLFGMVEGMTFELAHIMVFGSNHSYTIPEKNVKKLHAREIKTAMMAYSTQSKKFKVCNTESDKFVVVSRDQ